MATLITIANQKGGVGKTTTAVNLSTCLALAGRQCLLVDLDPQCNATSGLGVPPGKRHALLDEKPLEAALALADSPTPGLQVLPGSPALAEADGTLPAGDQTARIQRALSRLAESDRHQLVFLDCPPSFGQLTRAALAASHAVLIPIQCEYFAMEGLGHLLSIIRSVRTGANPRLRIDGILLTMFDPALQLTREVADEVRSHFPELVYNTVIPRDVEIAEAPSHGLSVVDYAPRSRGTKAHIDLALEVIARE